MHRHHILFVTWDGPDQTYLESLFLPILAALERHIGVRFSVLQHTWSDDTARRARGAADALGITYLRGGVVRRPLSAGTALTIARGAWEIGAHAKRLGVQALLPRSIIPAAMALAAIRRHALPLIFDADGLPADERVENQGWSPNGPAYRLFREIEATAVRRASAVLARTERARDILVARAGAATDAQKIFVVPNLKDEHAFTIFDASTRSARRGAHRVLPDAPWIVYAGSLGPHYHPSEMLAFAAMVHARRSSTRFTLLTGQIDLARSYLGAAGLDQEGWIEVLRLPAGDVPAVLAAADIGVAFRTPAFSQQAVAPIKVAEYLLCGVPVLSTGGVGDLDKQIDNGVGLLLPCVSDRELSKAADWSLETVLPSRPAFRGSCRRRGLELFGLDHGIHHYERALRYGLGLLPPSSEKRDYGS